MKKKLVWMLTAGMIVGAFGGCGQSEGPKDAISIQLSDAGITVDGIAISTDENADVYAANDIVFYLADQGFTYGEGEPEDEHTQEEADNIQ